jgi:hypothetical protein
MIITDAITTLRKWDFLFLVCLALFALAATALATNITTCGTYSADNEVYTIINEIHGDDAGAVCLTFSGNNQTINGNAQNITGKGTLAINITGNNNYLYKLSVRPEGTGGHTYSLAGLDITGANNTVRYIGVYGNTPYGMNYSGFPLGTNNAIEHTFLNGTADGYGQPSTCSNSITLTNVDTVNGITITAGSTVPTDGGQNYWDACAGAGGCAWYALTVADVEPSYDDTYTSINSSSTNFGSSTGGAAGGLKIYYFRTRNLTNPTARIWTTTSWAFNFTNGWANTSGANIYATPLSGNYSSFGYGEQYGDTNPYNWDEYVITHNNKPSALLAAGFTSTWATGSAARSLVITGAPTALQMANYTRSGGIFVVVNTNNLSSTDAAGGTQSYYATITTGSSPMFKSTWRPANGYHTATADLNTTYTPGVSSTTYTTSPSYAMSTATYCSEIVPYRANTFRAYNYFTGALQSSTFYYGKYMNYNSSHEWAAWECSASSFYYLTYSVPTAYVDFNPCAAGYTTLANFTYLDEDTEAAVNMNATVQIEYGDGTLESLYTLNNTNATYVCGYQAADNQTIRITLTYQNTTSGLRNYYLSTNLLVGNNITAYSGATSELSYVKFITTNQFGTGVGDRIQHYLRYFPTLGTWKLVAMGQTDSDGAYTSSIYTNGTTFYRIYSYGADWSPTLEKTWSSEPVYCVVGQSCEYLLTLPSTYSEAPFWTDYGLLSWNCTWNEINLTTCAWTDGTGTSHTFNLTTYRLGVGGLYQVCSSASTAASGTLYCTINDTDTNGSIYTMKFTRHSDDPRTLETSTYDFRVAIYKTFGAVFAFLLIVVSAFMAMFNPAVAVITAVIGLGVASYTGFISIPVAAIVGLALTALIIAWKQGGG